MKCPKCNASLVSKNGHRKGRQCYKCKQCGRQFLDHYPSWQYSNDVKQLCLKMYLNGMGLRGIERVTDIHHTTILHWVRAAGLSLPDAPESPEIAEIADLDELETFVGNKQNKLWIWTAVNHFQAAILAWVIGDRSAKTFQPLWLKLKCFRCFFYVTDGWSVYQCLSRVETTSSVKPIWLILKEKILVYIIISLDYIVKPCATPSRLRC